MPKIGPRTLNVVKGQISALLDMHESEIDEAYLQAEKTLTVGIKIAFTPDNKGTKIETSIAFTSLKITDDVEAIFDENQISFEFSDQPPHAESPPIDSQEEEISPDGVIMGKLLNEE